MDANELRERPIGEVAGELTRDLSTLARKELELAKAELREKGRQARGGMVLLAAAAASALAMVGALTAAMVLGLAVVLDGWLAALVTAVVLAGVTGALWLVGRERIEEVGSPLPEETIETIKEDAEWVTTRARSGRR
ncbi:MAG: phage holin family protein [Gaiella sp.]